MNSNFIAFDGEGLNVNNEHKLILLASSFSKTDYIYNKNGLKLDECLNFITRFPNAVNVWFSFNYDINMIFKYADEQTQKELFVDGETIYNDFKIKYIPKKILTIKNLRTKTHFTHYDTWGFFQGSFLKALQGWNIKYNDIIDSGKIARKDFNKWKKEDIIKYNYEECLKLVELMNALEDKLIINDIHLRSWHGAGAISSYFLKNVKMENHKPLKLEDRRINHARKLAYFGGRNEGFIRGYLENVHHYDINSAYPTACLSIPSLRDKKFNYFKKIHESDLDNDTFGMVECSWNTTSKMGCLPFRLSPSNMVIFPTHGHGFYHWIEVQQAIKKGYDIKLGQAFTLEKPYTFPLKKYIIEIMQKRLEYKKKKDLAHIPLKLGANGLYGKLAQKPIRKNKDDTWFIPPYMELMWAGYITAFTRSELLKYSEDENIIMHSTDGIFSKTKLKCPIGENLGEYEYELHPKAIFLLSGVYGYTTVKNPEWEFKKRGYKELDVLYAYEQAKKGKYVEISDRRFISIKLGLKQKVWKKCEFVDIPRVVDWNNNRKRDFLSFNHDSTSYPTDDLDDQSVSSPYEIGGVNIDNDENEMLSLDEI